MVKKNSEANTGSFKKIFVIVGIIIIIGCILVLFFSGAIYRPFEDFKGPGYLPANYNNSDNLTTSNERIFEYSGNGTFWVGVVKDPNQQQLNETMNPFKDDPDTVKETKENLTINGHNITLQISEMSLNIKEIVDNTANLDQLNNPNISFAKFQARWYCEETGLNYFAMGLVTSEQMAEMKKMMESIVCHKNNAIFKF